MILTILAILSKPWAFRNCQTWLQFCLEILEISLPRCLAVLAMNIGCLHKSFISVFRCTQSHRFKHGDLKSCNCLNNCHNLQNVVVVISLKNTDPLILYVLIQHWTSTFRLDTRKLWTAQLYLKHISFTSTYIHVTVSGTNKCISHPH